MDKKIIKFDDTKIEEYKVLPNRSPISINDIDLNKIVVSNKLLLGKQDFKYFIGYKDSQKNKPLCTFHTQMIICKRNFDGNKRIYFLIKKKKFSLNLFKFWKKLAISSKANLIVNLYIVKNI